MDGPKRHKICKTSRELEQMEATDAWIEYSTCPSVWSPAGRPARAPSRREASALSFFVGKDGEKEPIEPLHGLGRHP